MSNFIVPNTFVPGTKAKAQEVNENFVAVQDELNQKAEKAGNSAQVFSVANATENTHAVNKSQFETAVSNAVNGFSDTISRLATHFVIESARTNSSGNPSFMAYSGGTLSFRVDNSTYGPIVAVPANNQPRFTVTSVNSINMSSYADGDYNIFLKSNGTAYAYNNTIYTQKAAPESPLNNTVFVNTSVSPLSAKIYKNNSWTDFNDVFLGTATVESGSITAVKYNQFNDNGFNVNKNNIIYVKDTYINAYSGYRIFSDGYCEQWSRVSDVSDEQIIYFVTPFANTAYNVQITTLGADTSAVYSIIMKGTSSSKTKTYFTITKRESDVESIYWFACGYAF